MEPTVTLSPTLPKRGAWINQTIILPSVGQQTFDAEGNLTIAKSKALLLIKETQDSFGFTVLPEPVPAIPPSSTPAAVAAALGATKLSPEEATQTVEELSELGITSQDEKAEIEPPVLTDADAAELDALSAKAAADQQVRDQLDALDLAGLLKVAAEFPDITKEQIAEMSDARLRNILYERLTK